MNKEPFDTKNDILDWISVNQILERLALHSDLMNEELFDVRCYIQLNQCKPIIWTVSTSVSVI